jgi:hypothetical protein
MTHGVLRNVRRTLRKRDNRRVERYRAFNRFEFRQAIVTLNFAHRKVDQPDRAALNARQPPYRVISIDASVA